MMLTIKKNATIMALLLFGLLLFTGCQNTLQETPDSTGQSDLVDVVVKFSEGTDIRLRDGELVSLSSGTIPELDKILEEYPITNIERAFSESEEEIESEREGLIEEGETDVPDLNLYFILTVSGQDAAMQLIQQLNQLEIVQQAELAPEPAPPPVENPS